MEAKYSYYDFEKSMERIDNVLNSSDASYQDRDEVPVRSALTFSNGYYVYCSALFVDMRASKALAGAHTRPVLAKMYKVYISELVAVLKSHVNVSEIYIEGDCVWGIYNTPQKSDIDEVFSVAAMAASLIDVLNVKYVKRGYSAIKAGIGMSYGESLLIKAGFEGSGINEVVWLGKLVGEAAMLCSYGSKSSADFSMMVSDSFYNNLNEQCKKLVSWNSNRGCYHGWVVNLRMNDWVLSKA